MAYQETNDALNDEGVTTEEHIAKLEADLERAKLKKAGVYKKAADKIRKSDGGV